MFEISVVGLFICAVYSAIRGNRALSAQGDGVLFLWHAAEMLASLLLLGILSVLKTLYGTPGWLGLVGILMLGCITAYFLWDLRKFGLKEG